MRYMKLKFASAIALGSALSAVAGSSVALGADTLTVTANRVPGSEAVTVTGVAPAQQRLEAALYARFSKDVPTVLLSRWFLSSDANGHYNATLPTAPAFFRHAIVTVVVRTLPSGPSATTDVTVRAPNLPGPADELPPSVQ
jgi:hypothetical protein